MRSTEPAQLALASHVLCRLTSPCQNSAKHLLLMVQILVVASQEATMQVCYFLQVGDVGLAQLAHQRGLVTLLLDKCCVTDAGTAHLAGRVLLIAISLLSTWKSVKTCMRSVTPVTKQSLGACL